MLRRHHGPLRPEHGLGRPATLGPSLQAVWRLWLGRLGHDESLGV